MGAKYELRGNVAVITLDNPPVNGLGAVTRLGVVQGLEQAQAGPSPAAPTSASSARPRHWPNPTC